MRINFKFLIDVMNVAIILFIDTSLCRKDLRLSLGIVGGQAVDIKLYPFTVMIFNTGGMCAGSIINSWSVLTAAHCFEHNTQVEHITVHAGSRFRYHYDADILNVSLLVLHADYNKAMPFACDIAMLFVETPFNFGSKVQRAILVNSNKWMNKNEKMFHTMGWGQIEYDGPLTDEGLMVTQLRYIPSNKCGRLHGLTLTKDMFCLYGDGKRDACKGDSGGPVIWNNLLVGVVSHGDGCAGLKKPSVYANVFYFRNWIRKTIQNYFDNYCNSSHYVQIVLNMFY